MAVLKGWEEWGDEGPPQGVPAEFSCICYHRAGIPISDGGGRQTPACRGGGTLIQWLLWLSGGHRCPDLLASALQDNCDVVPPLCQGLIPGKAVWQSAAMLIALSSVSGSAGIAASSPSPNSSYFSSVLPERASFRSVLFSCIHGSLRTHLKQFVPWVDM